MGFVKNLIEALRIERDKQRKQQQKYRIEYAFSSGGTKYYRFADIANLPYERGLMAVNIYNEVEMRCDRKFLIRYVEAMENVLHKQTIDIFTINKLNEILKQRLQMPTHVDLLYKLASVVFFDDTENPAVYEPEYAEKKIAKWRKDQGVRDFFMQMPLRELIPSSENVDSDLDTFSAIQKELDMIHSECIRLANSPKK